MGQAAPQWELVWAACPAIGSRSAPCEPSETGPLFLVALAAGALLSRRQPQRGLPARVWMPAQQLHTRPGPLADLCWPFTCDHSGGR